MPGSDGLRIWVFWKTRQLGIRLLASRVGSLLRASLVEYYCRPVELGTWLGPVQLGVDFGHVESWSWVKTMVLSSWSLTKEFCRSLPTEILKITRCAERLSFVSIECLRIVSLSPRVEEPNSEVKNLINVRTWTTESLVYLSPPVFLHMYNVCDWYDYTTLVKRKQPLSGFERRSPILYSTICLSEVMQFK